MGRAPGNRPSRPANYRSEFKHPENVGAGRVRSGSLMCRGLAAQGDRRTKAAPSPCRAYGSGRPGWMAGSPVRKNNATSLQALPLAWQLG